MKKWSYVAEFIEQHTSEIWDFVVKTGVLVFDKLTYTPSIVVSALMLIDVVRDELLQLRLVAFETRLLGLFEGLLAAHALLDR